MKRNEKPDLGNRTAETSKTEALSIHIQNQDQARIAKLSYQNPNLGCCEFITVKLY